MKTLWLLLPAALANMVPILAAKLFPHWDLPVDFGKKWHGQEFFGSHKTYRGLIAGILVGFLVFIIQQKFYNTFHSIKTISFFDYSKITFLFGAWLGLSALLGDLIKSFFKRRLGIASGKPWIPFDQIDWILGALLCLRIVFIPNFELVSASLLVYTCLHFLLKYIGYVFKLNPTPL